MNFTFSSDSSVIRTVGWLAYGIAFVPGVLRRTATLSQPASRHPRLRDPGRPRGTRASPISGTLASAIPAGLAAPAPPLSRQAPRHPRLRYPGRPRGTRASAIPAGPAVHAPPPFQ
ncbi:hypothetical protein chiPu_0027667 [Chiloscyllium punctatum]|uniref:Uncharacterized protein n=1 Tax=Chiloscyllium punctatum TaxID=137246 RepID=A0A401TM71_CHIPU|nr:hypothetical protein [Chiloscyllium punctatum]